MNSDGLVIWISEPELFFNFFLKKQGFHFRIPQAILASPLKAIIFVAMATVF